MPALLGNDEDSATAAGPPSVRRYPISRISRPVPFIEPTGITLPVDAGFNIK